MKKNIGVNLFLAFVFTSFSLAVIYAAVFNVSVSEDYMLLIFQNSAGAALLLLPILLRCRTKLHIPAGMLILYAAFLYCAIFLGTVFNFYFRVPHWDTILHLFSGVMLGIIGFSVVNLFNRSDKALFSLQPGFAALFAFCFALALGGIWEIFEFSMDYFAGTNMQMYALEDGTPYIGQAALFDTMKDLVADAIGALVVSVFGFVSLKYKKGWLEQVLLRREQKTD